MVVAPYNLARDRDLTMVAMRGPGIEPGYLRSASTQRAGFLTLVDIGPTILDTFGIARPVHMEGRPAVDVASGSSTAERVEHLVTRNRESRFREQLLTPTTTVLVRADDRGVRAGHRRPRQPVEPPGARRSSRSPAWWT